MGATVVAPMDEEEVYTGCSRGQGAGVPSEPSQYPHGYKTLGSGFYKASMGWGYSSVVGMCGAPGSIPSKIETIPDTG